jgi:uncharacterized protein YecT (DUF1311 family)
MLSTCHTCQAPLGPTARVCLQCGTLRATAFCEETATSKAATNVREELLVASGEADVPTEDEIFSDSTVSSGNTLLVIEPPKTFDKNLARGEGREPPPTRVTARPSLADPTLVSERASRKSTWIAIAAAGGGLAAIGTSMAFYIVSSHSLEPIMKTQAQAVGVTHPSAPPAETLMITQPGPAQQPLPTETYLAETNSVDLPTVQAAYQHSIQTMNALWHALPLDLKHSLLSSQRAWIKDKVQDCRARTSTLPMTGDVQEAARLQCEMQRDQERLRQLLEYRAAASLPDADGNASAVPSIGMAPP